MISGNIQNIFLVFLGLKGDLFIRIPLLEATKKKFPDSKITVIVDEFNLNVLSNHPDVDEILTYNRDRSSKIKKVQRFINMVKIIKKLREKKFDLIINFYSGGSSNLIVYLAKSKYKVGFEHKQASRISNNILVPVPNIPDEHFVYYWAHLLQPLGIDPYSVRRGSSYFLDDEGKEFARKTLSKYKGEHLVVFNLATSGKGKTWPITSFVDLSIKLHELYNVVPVVFTNPGMESVTDDFIKIINNKIPVVRLPLTPFNKEAAIMNECHAVITGDTSLMHLSIALKKPTLTIYLVSTPGNVSPEDCLYLACDLRMKKDSSNIDNVIDCYTKLEDRINSHE